MISCNMDWQYFLSKSGFVLQRSELPFCKMDYIYNQNVSYFSKLVVTDLYLLQK
jgi:hypothetical protein